jgi:hypothetical protein
MLKLCVTEDEFRVILWPEFPQSRPATGVSLGRPAGPVRPALNGGSVSSVRDMGGHVYKPLSVPKGTTVPVPELQAPQQHHVRRPGRRGPGAHDRLDPLDRRARGRFKVYSMKD